MRRAVPILVVVVVLIVMGGVLSAGLFERRMAIAQEDMAVLDFADPQIEYAKLEEEIAGVPLISDGALKDIHRRRAMLQYWQGDYKDLIEVARSPANEDDGRDRS